MLPREKGDLTGRLFGRLRVLRLADYAPGKGRVWTCVCACGRTLDIAGHRLTTNRNPRVSCGCAKGENVALGTIKRSADLAGQRFGKLVVVERAEAVGKKGCGWLCACDCGGRRVVTTSELRDHNVCDCGCTRGQGRRVDLVGQTFGHLTVVAPAAREGRKGRFWECRCACGNTVVFATGNLKGNNGCGCHMREIRLANGQARLIDIAAMRSGKLVAVARTGKSCGADPLWLCRCDCGNEKAIRGSAIRGKAIISCGCEPGGFKPAPLLPKERRHSAAARGQTRRARSLAAGGSFTPAQIEDLYRKQKGRCGEGTCRVKLGDSFHRDHHVPISRGGSNDIKNIVLLCAPCNIRKRDKDPIVWARQNGRLL